MVFNIEHGCGTWSGINAISKLGKVVIEVKKLM